MVDQTCHGSILVSSIEPWVGKQTLYPQLRLMCSNRMSHLLHHLFQLGFLAASCGAHHSLFQRLPQAHEAKKNTWMHVKTTSRGGTLQHVNINTMTHVEHDWNLVRPKKKTSSCRDLILPSCPCCCHDVPPSDLSTFIVDAPTRIVRYRHTPPDHSKLPSSVDVRWSWNRCCF